jgi:putative ABC transport system permease protein
MSFVAALGALEIGLVYGLVAIGVFLSFRVLNFPDLTVDGSFPLGAAVAAAGILGGIDPYVASLLAILAGGVSGWSRRSSTSALASCTCSPAS